MNDRLPIAVLISGQGSNLQALIDACAKSDYPARIAVVLSNRPDAAGLRRAESAGIPAIAIDHRLFPDRKGFEDAVHAALERHAVRIVCLAGFMRVLTDTFVAAWEGRLINIHPSLLPAFRGLDTHRRAIEAGVRFAGCTVHYVCADVDAGPIIAQAVVPVLPDDDEASLGDRILGQEHRLYPLAIRLIAEGHVRLVAGRVVVSGVSFPCGGLVSPIDRLPEAERDYT